MGYVLSVTWLLSPGCWSVTWLLVFNSKRAVTEQLHAAFLALGGAGVQCHGPQDGVALLPGTSMRLVLAGATYISAVNANGDTLQLSFGTEV